MLTNIRTRVQFTQYGDVKTVIFNGNKLRALNEVKSAYGVRSVSILHEYVADGFLQEGIFTSI